MPTPTKVEDAGIIRGERCYFVTYGEGDSCRTTMMTADELRVEEILEETRLQVEAEKAATALDLPTGETLAGVRQTEAARARLRENGIDPDSCEADEFVEALEAVGEQPDDVTVIRVTVPLKTEPAEPVVGDDLDREARQLLVVRGQEDTYDNYSAALTEVVARRERR